MRKLLYILIFIPFISFSQAIPTPPNTFGTVADLRLQAGTPNVQVLVNGLITVGDKNGGTYMWKSTDVTPDDGVDFIQVTGVATGRWIKILNSNTLKGTKTFSGISLTTSYPIIFDTALPKAPAMVLIEPLNAASAIGWYITNKTTTGFTLNFITVPVIGTLNLNINYVVIKE